MYAILISARLRTPDFLSPLTSLRAHIGSCLAVRRAKRNYLDTLFRSSDGRSGPTPQIPLPHHNL